MEFRATKQPKIDASADSGTSEAARATLVQGPPPQAYEVYIDDRTILVYLLTNVNRIGFHAPLYVLQSLTFRGHWQSRRGRGTKPAVTDPAG